MVCIGSVILCHLEKQENPVLCDNIDDLRGQYAKQNAYAQKDKYHMTLFTCIFE